MTYRAPIESNKPKPIAPFAIAAVLVVTALIYAGGLLSAALVAAAFFVGYLPWGTLAHPVGGHGSLSHLSVQKRRRMARDTLSTVSNVDVERVLDIVRAGRKVEAIKEMRDISGNGLREAKEAVELLDERGLEWHQDQDPDWQ